MKIWMHTIGYPPERIGGTEVHVSELAEGLVSLGHDVTVSVPMGRGIESAESRKGVNLVVIDADAHKTLQAIADARPDVVHLHPLYLDDSVDLIQACSESHPVVVSYHTPTLTCMRGDLLEMGVDVCDGMVEHAKCTACVLNQKGVARHVASMLGSAPAWLCRAGAAILTGRARSMARWPLRVRELKTNMGRLWESCSRLIVVCDWLRDLVIANGMSDHRVSVVRYGRKNPGLTREKTRKGRLRLGYVGRLTDQKGVDVLLDAVEATAQSDYTVEFCAPEFEQDNVIADRIRDLATTNPSVRIKGSIPPHEVVAAMQEWDAVLVPSVWMETGPMVVTEAFHAGVPVIGSDRGGIAELVEDGRTGILCEAGNVESLADVIRRAACEPGIIRQMSENIKWGRETMAMAREVESIYSMVMR